MEEALQLARAKNREELLTQDRSKGGQDNDSLFLITAYNLNVMQLRSIVYDNWDMLGKSPPLRTYMRKNSCVVLGDQRTLGTIW